LLILTPENDVIKSFEVSNNDTKPNEFYLSLKPGKYTILKLLSTRGSSFKEIRLRANFIVPAESRSVYIGDLLWDEKNNSFQLHDNFQEAFTAFGKKFPSEKMKPTKSLLQKEALGTFKGVRHICAQSWGISCTDNFRGVEPVYPKMGTVLTSKVDSLLPTFEWNPSSNNEVTYDLVIFEQILYTPDTINYYPTSGRVFFYKENISESSYKLTQPLKPGSEYYWSVRLRKGDIASNWSTYNFFWTVLIAWSRGSNLWFTFATPNTAQ
jgi:hypothetical protein